MKNYCLDDNMAGKYIVDVSGNSDGTLTVEFADGSVFKHIDSCDENVEKIIAVQEEQAKKGIQDYAKFKSKEHSSLAKTIFSGLGILSAGVGTTFIPVIHEAMSAHHPAMIYAGIGAVAILGAIPAYAKLRRDRSNVKELDKLRFRNEHLDDLQQFSEYPNALAGVNPRLAKWMRREDDPFCILYTDNYDLEDLERIVSNIEVEKSFDFTYKPKAK